MQYFFKSLPVLIGSHVTNIVVMIMHDLGERNETIHINQSDAWNSHVLSLQYYKKGFELWFSSISEKLKARQRTIG